MNATSFKKLENIAEIKLGYPFRRSIPMMDDGDTIVVQMRDIQSQNRHNDIQWAQCIKTKLPGRNDKKQDYILEKDDILFPTRSMSASMLKPALVKEIPTEKDYVAAPHFFRIRLNEKDKEKIKAEYLIWWLTQWPVQHYIETHTQSSSRLMSVSKIILNSLEIPLIDLSKQEEIIKINQKIEEQENYIQAIKDNNDDIMNALANEIKPDQY